MASRLLLPRSKPSRLLALRHRSDLRFASAGLAEPEAGPSVDIDDSVRRLEDAIHEIDVRRAAPLWLPFLPGSSFWVPPRRRRVDAGRVARLVGKIADPSARCGGVYYVPGFSVPLPPHPFEENLPDRSAVKSDDDEA